MDPHVPTATGRIEIIWLTVDEITETTIVQIASTRTGNLAPSHRTAATANVIARRTASITDPDTRPTAATPESMKIDGVVAKIEILAKLITYHLKVGNEIKFLRFKPRKLSLFVLSCIASRLSSFTAIVPALQVQLEDILIAIQANAVETENVRDRQAVHVTAQVLSSSA